MAKESGKWVEDLSQKAIIILSLATFVWGTFIGTAILDALFRAAIVYIVASIIALILKRFFHRTREISAYRPVENNVGEVRSQQTDKAASLTPEVKSTTKVKN